MKLCKILFTALMALMLTTAIMPQNKTYNYRLWVYKATDATAYVNARYYDKVKFTIDQNTLIYIYQNTDGSVVIVVPFAQTQLKLIHSTAIGSNGLYLIGSDQAGSPVNVGMIVEDNKKSLQLRIDYGNGYWVDIKAIDTE